MLAHAILLLEMPEKPENQQNADNPPGNPIEGTVHIRASAKSTSSASVRIRLIRRSPVTDPKKVEAARASVQKLTANKLKKRRRIIACATPGRAVPKKSKAEDIDDLDLPLIIPG